MARMLVLSMVLSCLAAAAARAEVTGKPVPYRHGDVALEGYLARDDGGGGKRAGILIAHAWRGHSDFVRGVARDLAARGYVAFALDMYGEGVYAKDNQEAGRLAGRFKNDRSLMRERARAGLEVLKRQPDVDPARIVAIGFCFGGTVVLELARDGADLAGVVTFHGGLETPMPAEKGAVKPALLILHGGDDPHVPPNEVLAFWQEMKDAGASYELVILSGAVHAFTDPGAGDDPSKGAAYDERAAKRAWTLAYDFFRRRVGKAGPREAAPGEEPSPTR